jgi:hypothetical protein
MRIAIALLGLLLIGILPWAWQFHAWLGVLLLIPIIPWCIWLMFEYLRWAKGLGK